MPGMAHLKKTLTILEQPQPGSKSAMIFAGLQNELHKDPIQMKLGNATKDLYLSFLSQKPFVRSLHFLFVGVKAFRCRAENETFISNLISRTGKGLTQF